MGIGRFSLTPQIPLMIEDGFLTLSSAGILAAMNYIGYLLGAIHVSKLKRHHTFYLKTGLMATVLVTLLSAATSSFMLQCLFRFVSGVGGAWALIIVTSWTQLVLAGNQAAFFWPLFGLAAVAGVLLVIAFAARIRTQPALATAMIVQGAGVASVVFFHDAKGLLIATLLTGLGFLSIMQLSMRLAREVTQGAVARTVAVLTSGYATGQLIGPLMSSLSVTLFHSLEPALLLAAAGLVAGGILVLLGIKNTA
ncbi:putative MFS family arabinose efflux permease [Erwinia sp. TECH1]